jgi:hypothetical protein
MMIIGKAVMFENNDPIPSLPNAARKVVQSWPNASPILDQAKVPSSTLVMAPLVEDPSKARIMLTRVVPRIARKTPPFTLRITKTAIKIIPKIAKSNAGVLKATNSGTPEPKEIRPKFLIPT